VLPKALAALRPTSLSGLLLLALALVALPLLFGTVNAVIQMRDLASASERLVLNGVGATRYTQAIVRQVASLERTARLYQIMQRPALLDAFRQNQRLLERNLAGLQALPGDPQRNSSIERMRADAAEIGSALESQSIARTTEALRRFPQLSREAGTLSTMASAQIDRELGSLQTQAERTRRRVYWQAAALVPLAIGSALWFASFLGRRIRRIDRAIAAIGEGRLETPINVQGPQDLVALGRQLEWLRVRLRDVTDERNRFMRHLSHEFKTPLANLREGSELLAEGAVGSLNEDQREVVGILRENGLRLQRLIENLLSYSEWQARRGDLELAPLRLAPLLRATLETYRLQSQARRVRVELDVEDIEVLTDRSKLRLIVDNLVSNALKFTPEGGKVRVAAQALDDDRLRIEVTDDGPGFSAEDRARAFEAFYQGRTPAGGMVRGTGIGLSIVHEFAVALGGRAEILDRPGGGALVRVDLPLRGESGPARSPAADTIAH
jgi:two-component system sensor histidine kinase GlrK